MVQTLGFGLSQYIHFLIFIVLFILNPLLLVHGTTKRPEVLPRTRSPAKPAPAVLAEPAARVRI